MGSANPSRASASGISLLRQSRLIVALLAVCLNAIACRKGDTFGDSLTTAPAPTATAAPSATAPVVSLIAPTTQAAATSQPAPAPLANGSTTRPVALITADLKTQSLSGLGVPQGEMTIVPATDMPFEQAVRIHTVKQPTNPWDLQFKLKTTGPITIGDSLLATFYMRTIDTTSESGEARISLAMQQTGPPWGSSLEQEMSAPRTWMKVTLPFAARQSLPAGKAQATLNFGFEPQTIEVADFSLFDYGPSVHLKDLPQPQFSYAGREPDAAWRKEAADRIEKIRKGDLSITVVDANQNPVPDATVSVDMTRHAFGFGSAITAKDLMGITPDDQKYRDVVQKCFNRIVFENDMKWRTWEDVNRDKRTEKAVKWLRNHNIDVRGHCMVWPGWNNLPDDLKPLKDNQAALAAKVDAHINDIATAFAPMHLCAWDVVNETRTNHALQDILGHSILAHWFDVAHKAVPDVPLYLNENSVLETGTKADFFYSELSYLRDQNAPLGGIGLQGHFGWNPTPPAVILQRLDRFAAFNVPIEVTEFDVNVSDEQLQADYTRDMMTAVFSHPSTDSIIMWGFWDARHWLGNSPLYRRDWTLKPAGEAWMDLVFHQWWTNTKATTDASGKCAVRGFLGDYAITVKHDDSTVTAKAKLVGAGTSVQVVLP